MTLGSRSFRELLAQYLIARSAREDPAVQPLPSSLLLADEKRVCSFVRPGQRRAISARVEPAYLV
jgi:hypothetical protein